MQPVATAPLPGAFPMPQPGMPMPGPGMAIPQPGMPMPGPGMAMPQPGIPMVQPGIPMMPQGGWPPPNSTCPPGLEYLMALDYLAVNQKVELLEAFTGWETQNKFNVVNLRGEPVFYVAEDSSICSRLCLGYYRNCDFRVYDGTRREVLRMSRPLRCDGCCCPCFLQEMEVYSGEMLLGSVVQEWSLFRLWLSIRNAAGDTVLYIKGPCVRCCGNVTFQVKSVDGEHRVGVIKKKWSGVGREVFTDSDFFDISFPGDLDVKIKAVLLGACLLIDMMYFEGQR